MKAAEIQDLRKKLWKHLENLSYIEKDKIRGLISLAKYQTKKEIFNWWIDAFEQGSYTEKEALELMKDQLKEVATK